MIRAPSYGRLSPISFLQQFNEQILVGRLTGCQMAVGGPVRGRGMEEDVSDSGFMCPVFSTDEITAGVLSAV